MTPKDYKILLFIGLGIAFFWQIAAFIWLTWEIWALFGLAFIIIEIRHAYRHIKYLEQQKEEEKRKRLEQKALRNTQQ